MEIPLYDKLLDLSKQKKTTVSLDNISNILDNMLPEQGEEILLLIIHYYNSNNTNLDNFSKSKKLNYPYGIKVLNGGKGISFNIYDLPSELQSIITEYCLYD